MIGPDVATIFARQRDADPLVIDFARALAAATRIEVELVRHMRLELFPDADAGLESNLWFSPLVAERDVLGLSLVPECREELRRQLALPEHRETLKRAWGVIISCHRPPGHAGIPPVINLQEEITYHALAGPASDTPHLHRQAMQAEIGTLIKALDADSDGSLMQWVARALPALPEAARRSPAAISLAEKLRARDASFSLESIPRPDQQAGSATWTGTTIAIGCQRRTDGIELSVPPATGAHVLQLPRTSPLLVEIQTPRFDGWHTRSIEFEPVPEYLVPDPSPGSRCRITSATGHRVSLQPTYGETPPVLVVMALDEAPLVDAMRRAVAEIGWTVEARQRSRRRNARAMLPVNPLVKGLPRNTNFGVPVLWWTHRGLEPVIDPEQGWMKRVRHMEVFCVRYSTDGSEMAIGGPFGVQVVLPNGIIRSEFRHRAVFSASFNPLRPQLALVSDDAFLRLWVPGESEARTLEAHRDRLTSVEFGRSGRHLVSTSEDRSAALWLMEGQAKPRRWLRHDATINHAAFNPDESLVATACDDGTVCVWDVESGRKNATLRHDAAVRSVAWSAEGDRLVAAAGKEAHVWTLPAFERDGSVRHDDDLQCALISADRRRVATLDREGIARLWHFASRSLVLPAMDPNAGKNRRVPPLVDVHPHTPHGLAISPDGTMLLVASNGDYYSWFTTTANVKRLRIDYGNFPSGFEPIPPMKPEDLAALRRQLLAIDERHLMLWQARGTAAVAEPAPPASDTPPDRDERPRRALIGIVDDGIDVLHETFLDADGRSRIVAIWDQTDASGPHPEGFTYGHLHRAENIAAYVRRQSVPVALGRNKDGHGTHVASVAAGRRVGSFQGGVASAASIVVVKIAPDRGQAARSTLDGLAFIDRLATERQAPVVVNVSLALNLGSHDGKSAFEVGVDEFSGGGLKSGRVVVVPAGNGRGDAAHAQLLVPSGTVNRLRWEMEGKVSMAFVQVWAPASASYRFRLTAPSGAQSAWVADDRPAVSDILKGAGGFSLQLTKRHVDNGDTQLSIQLGDAGRRTADGVWELTIEATTGSEVRMDAWCDAVDGAIRFLDDVAENMTIGVPATARTVVAVSALRSPVTPNEAADFSALGPARDEWKKPDVAAPGVEIRGARGGTAHSVIAFSGTSMAAANVAGAIALLLDSMAADRERWPTVNQIKAALRQTARGSTGTWDPALGYGVVDANALLGAFSAQRLPASGPS